MRRLVSLLAAAMAVSALLATYAFVEARSDPVVRRAVVALPGWPPGAPPVRIALLSDLHVGTASTSPARLATVVAAVNAERPDLVLIAGDFLPGHHPMDEATAATLLAPLARLRAPLGVVAVPGNHDHWTMPGGIGPVLSHLDVAVLANRAVVRGPLVVGGVDDEYTHHDRLDAVVAEVRTLPGAHVVLTHSPDLAPQLPPDMPLMLAGHTHCGQVVLPLIGAINPVSRYRRYECGLVREGGRTTITGAGIGTSAGPFRLGAPPDWWLLTLGPRRPNAASRSRP